MNPAASIRLFQPADESRVREICFATALYGQPMDQVVSDAAWMTDVLLGYHFAAEPERLWVAEADGNVVGYLAGCSNALRQQRWFRRKALWPLLFRALRSRRILNARAARLARAAAGPSLGVHRAVRDILAGHPALLHLNLDASHQGQGIGARLLDAYIVRLREEHVPGVHLTTGTVAGQSFFGKHGFRLVTARPIPAVLGLPPGRHALMARSL